jgi:hypothetical protein
MRSKFAFLTSLILYCLNSVAECSSVLQDDFDKMPLRPTSRSRVMSLDSTTSSDFSCERKRLLTLRGTG